MLRSHSCGYRIAVCFLQNRSATAAPKAAHFICRRQRFTAFATDFALSSVYAEHMTVNHYFPFAEIGHEITKKDTLQRILFILPLLDLNQRPSD